MGAGPGLAEPARGSRGTAEPVGRAGRRERGFTSHCEGGTAAPNLDAVAGRLAPGTSHHYAQPGPFASVTSPVFRKTAPRDWTGAAWRQQVRSITQG